MTKKAIAIHDDTKRTLNRLWAFIKVAQHEAKKIVPPGVQFDILTDSIHYDSHNNCYVVLIQFEDRPQPQPRQFGDYMNQARTPIISSH